MTEPTALAQLRHLYQNMVNGAVRDTASAKRIAEGLLAPAIEALERSTPPAVAGEPVAEFDEWFGRPVLLHGAPLLAHKQKLYTTPQPTQAQAGAVPLTDEQKHARNPYRHSRGAASIWLAGFAAAELWYRIGIKGGQHGAE